MMNRHVEKLIHCDPRLLSLSQKNEFTLENPYFESRCSIFEDPDDVKCQDFEPNELDDDQLAPQRFRELLSHHSASSRIDAEGRQEAGASDGMPRHLSNSVTGCEVIEQDGASGMCEPQTSILSWNGFKLPGLRRSMSKSEIANHIGHHIYRQMYSGNLPAADGGAGTSGKLALDDITRYLLSDSHIINSGHDSAGELAFDEVTRQLLNDSQITVAADERMLMSRVNSLCSLIHKDSGESQVNAGVHGDNEMNKRKPQPYAPLLGGEDGSGSLPPRQEPFGDLLTHLPRISSFPHFL